MNLIDRYVAEVGKNLPLLKGREDIEKELRSTLEDMLEDRASTTGRMRDEAMEIELLKEYGSPQTVAATYNPQPYLIGPRLFPFFLMVLKIVITVLVTVLLILMGIRAVTDTPFMGAEFVNIIGKGLGGIVSAAIAAFGNIVLVFAILERVLPDAQINALKTDEEWDPASLANEPDPDTVKRGELIAEIVFTFVGLAILNLYPEILGMFVFKEGDTFFIPMFSDAFFKFIPWINAIFFAEIVLDIYLLRSALWTSVTRVAKIIIEAASIALTVVILRTPNIVGFTAESFKNFPDSSVNGELLMKIFNISFSIALVIVIIVAGVELAKAAYGLIRMNYRTK
ncbi:MAG: hypothetical protein IH588_02105 [Anaerolineales bacterium]|nr:hypothetical protein [Anaerolineales bacterium]